MADARKETLTSLDKIRKKKKKKTAVVPILMDPDVGSELDDLDGRTAEIVKRLRVGRKEDMEELQKEKNDLDQRRKELVKKVEDSSVEFHFQSIGRETLDTLLSENPPTNKQIEEARKEGVTDLMFNPETFPVALIAASSTDPDMSVEDVQELWDDENWSTPELMALFNGAQECNGNFHISSTKKGFGQTLS